MMFAGYQIDIGDNLAIEYDEVLPSGNVSRFFYIGIVKGTYPTVGGDTGMRLEADSGYIVNLIDIYVTRIDNLNDLLIRI